MEVKYLWKKMVCRMAGGQARQSVGPFVYVALSWGDTQGKARVTQGKHTFNDVLYAGKVGEDVQVVFWPPSWFHGRMRPRCVVRARPWSERES